MSLNPKRRSLVRQHNLGIVDQGAGNRHALHLSTRKLARALVNVLAQADFLQRLARTLAALGMAHTRERKRQLNVFQDGLMWDKVIALEHKADAVVAIGIPIAIVKVLGRDAVDEQVAGIEMIESTDYVEHRSFARARGAQNGHELVIAKRQAHAVERHLRKRLGNVPFANTFELQHGRQPLPRGRTRPLSPAVRIRRVCPTLSPFFAGASEECREPRQKTNGTAPKKEVPSGTSIWWSLS